MTPTEWTIAIGPHVPWQQAYKIIEFEGRKLLSGLPDHKVLNTAQFVEALLPATQARGPQVDARGRILNALMLKGPNMILKDCRTRDEVNVKKRYGHMIKPWLWHAPKAKAPSVCPHCGGILEVAA